MWAVGITTGTDGRRLSGARADALVLHGALVIRGTGTHGEPVTSSELRQRRTTPATTAQIAAWVALLIAVFWLSLRGIGTFQLGIYQDDASYVVLARSIAFGDHFGMINEPGPPPPGKFGFGFPLLLAPLMRLFPDNLAATTAVPLLATLLNLSLLCWGWPLLSPNSSRWWGLGIASLHGLSPMIVANSGMVMSEPVFTTFVLTGLLLTEACARRRSGRWVSVALGATLTLAFFTRPIGIALWAAALVRLGLANRGKDFPGVLLGSFGLLALVFATTPVALRDLPPWEFAAEFQKGKPVTAESPQKEGFLDQGLEVAAGYVFEDIRRAIVPAGDGERERAFAERLGFRYGPEVIGGAVTAVTLIGAWRCLRVGALSPVAQLFELFYFGGLLLWPWDAVRYMYPVQPLLSLQFLLGLAVIASWVRARPDRTAVRLGIGTPAALAWAALVVLSTWRSLAVGDSRSFTRDLRTGTTWLAANSPPDALVMARYPQAAYLYSGRKTVDLVAAPSAAAFDRVLNEKRIDYVLLGPKLTWSADGSLEYGDPDRSLLPVLAEMVARGRVELVYTSDPRQKVLVYRVNPPKTFPST
jgi:hypothetical protein